MPKFAPKTKKELKALIKDESVYLGDIDTSAITDMSYLFVHSKRLEFSGIESWDVSNVTNMNNMFYACYDFNQHLDNWNVSNVTDMGGMFAFCESFNQPLSSWNVSKVKHMCMMFCNCFKFNQPLNKWNVSNVIDFGQMFCNCENFEQNLDNWNVKTGADIDGMFLFAQKTKPPKWDKEFKENLLRYIESLFLQK